MPACLLQPSNDLQTVTKAAEQEEGNAAPVKQLSASKQLHEASQQEEQVSQEPQASVPESGSTDKDRAATALEANKQAEPSNVSELVEESQQNGKDKLDTRPAIEQHEQSGKFASPAATPSSCVQSQLQEVSALSEQHQRAICLSANSLHQESYKDEDKVEVKPSEEPSLREDRSQQPAADTGSPECCEGHGSLTSAPPSAAATPQEKSSSLSAQKDGQASVMDVLKDAQKLAATPLPESKVTDFPNDCASSLSG